MRDLYIKESSVQHWISLKKHKIIFNRMFYVGIINEGCKCDIVPLKKKNKCDIVSCIELLWPFIFYDNSCICLFSLTFYMQLVPYCMFGHLDTILYKFWFVVQKEI